MRLTAGMRLGPYEIVGLLGTGRMGEVYKARDVRLDRLVALKIVAPDAVGDPMRLKRFEREARAIANLVHPHICTLFDTGEDAGIAFLVMEYLPGETLGHRLLRGALPLNETLQIAVHLADALATAHGQGVTHRDLKPSNVMLTPAGVKVLDFGLASWDAEVPATSGSTLTHPGGIVGTLPYMPPEQFNGQPDARSDLFALGAIIFEMVTGRKAFAGDTPSALVAAIESGPTPSMLALCPQTPSALERVVRKCLAREPAKRWQTASDLRDELDWIAQDGQPDRTAAGVHRTPGRVRRQWIGVAGSVLVLLTAAAGGLSVARWRSPHESAPAPLTSFQVLAPDNASDVEQPTISPDGRTLAFVARIKDGKSALWIRPLESLEAHAIADADSFAFPFWSPDSRSLAFFNVGQLKRVAVGGGPAQVICPAPAGRGGTWSPSGLIVFAASSETALSQVSASGGVPKPATALGTSPEERSHRFPQFLADGRRFIYTTYLNDPNRNPLLKVASLDDTAIKVITETSFPQSFVLNGYVLFSRDGNGPFLAQRFDETTLTLESEPVAVIERPNFGSVGGAVGISASRAGALAYQTTIADATAQLAWFGRSGHKLALVGQPASFSFDAQFSLALDGSRVAALQIDPQTHREDIWIVDVLRGVRSRATLDGSAEDPKWSPDGRRIAFTSMRRGTGQMDIYVTPSTVQGPDEPLLTSRLNKYLWDWSPDGAFLLFSAQEGPKGVHNLWTLPISRGAVPTRYLATEFDKAEARVSPNARWVAYQSNESGLDQVFVQSYPDPATRYQVSSAGGARPRWRHDGKELFYISPDGTLMAATISSNGRLEVGMPRGLFRTSSPNNTQTVNFEVAPDGQRFLIAEVVSQPSRSPITVLLNWNPFQKK